MASFSLRRRLSLDGLGTVLLWLIIGLALLTALLLPRAVDDQRIAWWFEHVQAAAYAGNVVMLVLAARRASGRHQLAALVLVVGQLLMLATIIEHIAGYQPNGAIPNVPLLLYIVIYGCSTFGLTLLFPIERWRRGDLLRILSDVLLSMSVADVLLQAVLSRGAPLGVITPQVAASAFRLVTSVGLAVWCVQLYRRYAAWQGAALRLFSIGMLGLLCTDALLLAATALAEQGASPLLLRVVVPSAIVHQTCWTAGLWASRGQRLVWRTEPQWPPQRTGFLGTILALRQVVVLSGLGVTLVLSPSLRAKIWFVGLLLLREWVWGRTFGRTVQQLDQAQAEVRLANTRLELFVRSVVHDLRTPAQFFAYLLGRSNDNPDQALLQQQASHVGELINRLGEYVEAHQLTIQLARVDLLAVADDAIRAIYPEALEQGVSVHVETPQNLPDARADAVAVRRILDNLLRNALRATEAGGTILVSMQRRRAAEHSLSLSVCDTGHGIEPALLPHIYEPNVRGFTQGTGLGLDIVRTLTQALGGTISVVSAVGYGTTFTIRLPTWQEHDAEGLPHDNDIGD